MLVLVQVVDGVNYTLQCRSMTNTLFPCLMRLRSNYIVNPVNNFKGATVVLVAPVHVCPEGWTLGTNHHPNPKINFNVEVVGLVDCCLGS